MSTPIRIKEGKVEMKEEDKIWISR